MKQIKKPTASPAPPPPHKGEEEQQNPKFTHIYKGKHWLWRLPAGTGRWELCAVPSILMAGMAFWATLTFMPQHKGNAPKVGIQDGTTLLSLTRVSLSNITIIPFANTWKMSIRDVPRTYHLSFSFGKIWNFLGGALLVYLFFVVFTWQYNLLDTFSNLNSFWKLYKTIFKIPSKLKVQGMQQCPLLFCTQRMCHLTFLICITRCLNGDTYSSLMRSSASKANSKNKYSFPSSGRNALLMCTRENLPLYLHIVFVQVSRAMIKGHGQRQLKHKSAYFILQLSDHT